jgi:hypothetical protein
MDVTLWWGVAETTHKTAAAILSKFPYLKVLYRYTIESLIGLITVPIEQCALIGYCLFTLC